LQTAPPTGEAAKLASDVAQITSYSSSVGGFSGQV
jgi:hypothetical protein